MVEFKAHDNTEDTKQIARLLPATGGCPSGDDLEDAVEVARRIINLVSTLDLPQSLLERGVGKDQIPIIVERATGLKDGPTYDAIARLVEGFF